jgi:CRP-like cAMP-binding protein
MGYNSASTNERFSARPSVTISAPFEEVAMSRPRNASPPKRRTGFKASASLVFNPAVFLTTAAPGRHISTHAEKELIFAQGDNADSVFYIKEGTVKVAVLSKDRKEAVLRF